MPRPRHQAPSFLLVGPLTLGGGLALAFALRARPHTLSMLPGMDGCLTAGIVAFGLALLHGLSYEAALALLVPIAVIQAAGAAVTGVSIAAVLGLEALVVGGIGVFLQGRARSRAERAAQDEPKGGSWHSTSEPKMGSPAS